MGQGTIAVGDANFEQAVLQAGGPVLVDFWAEWCGPCKMIGPVLEELAIELQGKITIAKLNVDEAPMIASKFGIRSIPTLMLFKDGKQVATKIGGAPKTQLQQWILSAL